MVADRSLEIHPVTAPRWADVATLFQQRGPRGGRQVTANCWCAVWRAPYRTPEENEQHLHALVDAGQEPGLLAYLDGEPAGWISIAPREQFPGLLRSRRYGPHEGGAGVHVVSCFHVDRPARGQGLAGALLLAAVDHARRRGAHTVEAFPGDPPDYKGDLRWFLEAGFVPVREAGGRTVVRLDLGN